MDNECDECGEKAFRCNYCEAKSCWCAGKTYREEEIAVCGDCEDRNMETLGNYLHHRKLKHTGLVAWFPLPQVSFPEGVAK